MDFSWGPPLRPQRNHRPRVAPLMPRSMCLFADALRQDGSPFTSSIPNVMRADAAHHRVSRPLPRADERRRSC